jgi:hypothetical protein
MLKPLESVIEEASEYSETPVSEYNHKRKTGGSKFKDREQTSIYSSKRLSLTDPLEETVIKADEENLEEQAGAVNRPIP